MIQMLPSIISIIREIMKLIQELPRSERAMEKARFRDVISRKAVQTASSDAGSHVLRDYRDELAKRVKSYQSVI